jgi:hypothetical protein
VTATNKHIPGKRLKTWHRKAKMLGAGSLREFARELIVEGRDDEKQTAMRWANGKVAS